RAAVTDGEGQYKIIDLRPGTYTVTFTLPGFSTVRRDAIELPAAFTATINAELRGGTGEETVVVSGAAPTVDVQHVLQQPVFEQQTSALVSNIIPKEGGNAFTGYLTASYSGDKLQGGNLSKELIATGLTSVSGLISLWEVTPAIGGRIVRDKLWFYSAFRAQS